MSDSTSVLYCSEYPHTNGDGGYEFLPDHRITLSKMLEIFGYPENKKLYRQSYRDIPAYRYHMAVKSTVDIITSWARDVVKEQRSGGRDKLSGQKIIAGEDNLRLFRVPMR